MAYRFTNTDKWSDSWFSELRPIEKLLFNYLCDNCDIAGFIELTPKKWAYDIGTDKPQIEGALKGLARGLIFSNTGDCIFIKNFLKHQKNLPINPNNKAHLGIIYRFESYKHKFGFTDYNEIIEGACKGLQSPTGIGIGNGLDVEESKEEKEKTKFDIFNDWLKTNYPNVASMKTQMTEQNLKSIIDLYGKDVLNNYLMQMENKIDLAKKYKSVYLTLLTWINRNTKK